MWSLLVTAVLAAPDAGPPLKPDAGSPRPPDAGVVFTVTDAGVAAPPPRPMDAVSTAEFDRLKKRVSELEARNVEVERQLRQLDGLPKRLDDLKEEFVAFKREVNEREEARRENERRASEAKQRYESGTRALINADQELATGSTASVAEQLRIAEATYTGVALQYVQAAKVALKNNDLGSARRMLLLAVLESQFNRPQ